MKPTILSENIYRELKSARGRTTDNQMVRNLNFNQTPHKTMDGFSPASLTFDAARQLSSYHGNYDPGATFTPQPYKGVDGKMRTVDSTGSFLVGELERLDMALHMPLVDITWSRDIELREDVTIGDDVSSFTLSSFTSPSGLGSVNVGAGSGIAWIGKKTNQVAGVEVDISKTTFALTPWGLENAYTIMELESAARLGRPIDSQKLDALKLQHQMNIDQMVYVGDASISATGLLNNSLVSSAGGTVGAAATGVSGFTQWSKKTADEITTDISNWLATVWAASAWAIMPTKLLLPPAQYAYIASQKVGQSGTFSILDYILENNLLAKRKGVKLEIEPCKWLQGAGTASLYSGLAAALGNGGYDRAVVYTPRKDLVRYPMTLLQRTPVQFDSIWHKSTYFCKLGQIETVYPETIGYFDGI